MQSGNPRLAYLQYMLDLFMHVRRTFICMREAYRSCRMGNNKLPVSPIRLLPQLHPDSPPGYVRVPGASTKIHTANGSSRMSSKKLFAPIKRDLCVMFLAFILMLFFLYLSSAQFFSVCLHNLPLIRGAAQRDLELSLLSARIDPAPGTMNNVVK